ncbi:hypothetical protein [Okeania sp. SIO3B5]|nr:hypothetical protein [Okeania sp. SIO3B5]
MNIQLIESLANVIQALSPEKRELLTDRKINISAHFYNREVYA